MLTSPGAVSYTHLDVYKRQLPLSVINTEIDFSRTSQLVQPPTDNRKKHNHQSIYVSSSTQKWKHHIIKLTNIKSVSNKYKSDNFQKQFFFSFQCREYVILMEKFNSRI